MGTLTAAALAALLAIGTAIGAYTAVSSSTPDRNAAPKVAVYGQR